MSRSGGAGSARILLLLPALAVLAVPVAAAGEIPDSLREIVMGGRHRPIVEIELDGTTFHGLARSSDVPYLLWPMEPADVPDDHDGAAVWIRRAAAELGHRDFEPRYVETTDWRGNEVWSYELVRRGIPLHDARVMLHWRQGRFIGLVNAVPLPIRSIEDLPEGTIGADERVYAPRRGKEGYDLRLARVQRQVSGSRMDVSLVIGGETIRRIVEPLQTSAAPAATIQEWSVPQGDFPDQIDIDSTGVIWFSQPNNDWVTSFDPATEVFTQHGTTGGDEPDGLMVDGNDVLWTGLYQAGGLGKFDIATSVFTSLGVPYSPANAAIPNETVAGTLWLTDHQNNRISEFDPGTGTWLQSLVMPTPNCWVVGGTEAPVSLDVYFTEYNVDQLGRKILGGPIVDIDVPPGTGPAFAVHSGGFIYFSEWNKPRLGAYELSSGNITEYAFPVTNENGGPIDATPGGLIAVGTRNNGYIMVFDPATTLFDAHPIPSALPGLKDGLRSDPNGSIWFTESVSTNKIAVLYLSASPPTAQFSGSPTGGAAPLTVEFTDLSTRTPTMWSWSFGDSGNSNLAEPAHEYEDPGLYTVSLTASNEFGSNVETKVDYIHVIPACPLSPADLDISGKRLAQDVQFNWQANADCQWDVHRATVPQNILATPPVATKTLPTYREHLTPEPLVFYNIAPANKDVPAP